MTGRRENYPFPHRGGYKQGFLPNRSREKMNRDLQHLYESWKALYLTTEGCLEGELRVSGGNCYQFGTCSEGTGYGMLLSVYMANAHNHAHEEFDSIFRYYKNHSLPECGLMRWEADRTGKDLSEYVAPDGDLDVAFALLAAHRQWGSEGEICYLEEGKTLVGNLMAYTVNKPQYLIARAQLENPEGLSWDYTMSSYQIPAYARLFAEITGDAGWKKVRDAAYRLFAYFYKLNPDTALAPFVFHLDTFGPGGGKPYVFSYDSCRVPWRTALDYLWYGTDETGLAHDYPHRNAVWFSRYMESLNWDFDRVSERFLLSGMPVSEKCSPRNITAMLAPAAMVDESTRELLDRSYDYLSRQEPMLEWPGDYFQDTLVLLGMLTITGNMPNFYTTEPYPADKAR